MPAQIVIVQRNLVNQRVWDFCDYWRGMGKTVIADLDDAYNMMPTSNPAYRFWVQNRGKLPQDPVEALAEGLHHVDGLTSPSRVILDDWKDIVPGYWLPNWAEGSWYKELPERKRGEGQLVIGWGGSVSHYDSWWGSGIREALAAICAEFPQVTVKICGNDPRIYDQLPVPEGQKARQRGVQPQDWPGIVNTFDIGIAPLSGDYDQRRSWIKALEYLLVGIPWCATSGAPYAEFGDFGMLVDEGPENWYDALKDIIQDYPDRLEAARRNREIGFSQTMEANIDNYANTCAKVSRARRNARLPGIAYVNWEEHERAGSGDEAAEDVGEGAGAQI